MCLDLEVPPNSTTKPHKYHLITRDINISQHKSSLPNLASDRTDIVHVSKVINGIFSASSMHGPWLARLTKNVG